MKISVVIVKYRSEKYLDQCLDSVKKEKPYEIIVVDNDKENRGYGKACNLGANKAKGELILFLNPDTRLLAGCLNAMQKCFADNSDVGIVGPKLYTSDKCDQIQLSCCRRSGLLTSLVVYGKLQHFWKDNPFWNHFTYRHQRLTGKPFGVSVVSGAALMVRKDVFEKMDGFDENIFMYFEENDLCLKTKELGYKVIYTPTAGVVHYGGGSTLPSSNSSTLFNRSRNYFFNKHYPVVEAILINMLLK